MTKYDIEWTFFFLKTQQLTTKLKPWRTRNKSYCSFLVQKKKDDWNTWAEVYHGIWMSV